MQVQTEIHKKIEIESPQLHEFINKNLILEEYFKGDNKALPCLMETERKDLYVNNTHAKLPDNLK